MLTPLAAQALHWVITSVPRVPSAVPIPEVTLRSTALASWPRQHCWQTLSPNNLQLRRRQIEHMCRERKLCSFGRVLIHEREVMKAKKCSHENQLGAARSPGLFPCVHSRSLSSLLRYLDSSETQAPMIPTVCCKKKCYTLHVLAESSFCCYGVNVVVAVVFDSNMRILEREDNNCGVLCSLNKMQGTLLEKPDE